jgi:RNase P/RNase MRP subunit p30
MDVCFPDGNEKEFIEMASRLGISEICFVYSGLDGVKRCSEFSKIPNIKVFSGILCSPTDVVRFKGKVDFSFVDASSYPESVRQILEHARPDVVFNLERTGKHDFIHHRASGLNQVHCELMKKNGISLGVSFSSVLALRGKERARLLGRVSQNIRLARKYKLDVLFASFAKSPFGLRSRKDLYSLMVVLGSS